MVTKPFVQIKYIIRLPDMLNAKNSELIEYKVNEWKTVKEIL